MNRAVFVIVMSLATATVRLLAQGPPGPEPPRSAKAAAPVDLTGYWVSVISEDWRWRMVTPLKGDFASVPLTLEGRKVVEAWDPARDEAAGLQCKAYGAAAIMRVPGRVHITWQDDDTLKIELDAGTQTRLMHFKGTVPPDTPATWQGYSVANWERPPQGVGVPEVFPVFATRISTRGRALEVTTAKLRAGYLRKNGVPYSENASLKEFFDYHKEPNGDEWFTVTTVVRDPQYLREPFVTSSDFKKQPDATGWRPTPCSAR
ncbi:MAG: hypothetical protein C5B57_14035 [Blastocatellia bacterium]|nr:MAG: hypothetical protein C5B57_14035 [Blastocatellia bacterium]